MFIEDRLTHVTQTICVALTDDLIFEKPLSPEKDKLMIQAN